VKFNTEKPWPDGTKIKFADGTEAVFERLDRSTTTPAMVVRFADEDTPRAFPPKTWEKLHGGNIGELTFPDGEVQARPADHIPPELKAAINIRNKAERDLGLAKENQKFAKDCRKSAENAVKEIEDHLASGQGMLDFKAHE